MGEGISMKARNYFARSVPLPWHSYSQSPSWNKSPEFYYISTWFFAISPPRSRYLSHVPVVLCHLPPTRPLPESPASEGGRGGCVCVCVCVWVCVCVCVCVCV